MRTCDKKGIPIEVGDVLKFYHFTAALRRKRHYMYKLVIGTEFLGGFNGSEKTEYFCVSHLELPIEKGFNIGFNEGVLSDYEIVQCTSGMPEDRLKI
jgi:hypothetical protein